MQSHAKANESQNEARAPGLRYCKFLQLDGPQTRLVCMMLMRGWNGSKGAGL